MSKATFPNEVLVNNPHAFVETSLQNVHFVAKHEGLVKERRAWVWLARENVGWLASCIHERSLHGHWDFHVWRPQDSLAQYCVHGILNMVWIVAIAVSVAASIWRCILVQNALQVYVGLLWSLR